MRHRKRRLAAVTVGVTLLGLVIASTAAAARPVGPADEPGSAISLDALPASAEAALAALAGKDVAATLTLVTGDRVAVGLNRDGDPVVREIVAAPRDTGTEAVFYTLTRDGQVYVLPGDALPLVRAEVLDWDLFNLAELAKHAAEGTVGEVPVIITYRSAVAARRAPARVDGATVERALASIDGSAVTIDGSGDWWQEVQAAVGTAPAATASTLTGSGPLAGVEKVWLDELAEIDLDESVPQVGAPLAWARDLDGSGVPVAVLDTGIDADHPDVAGKVVAAADFTDNPTGPRDGHGHGTHVASTIAGTGAASGGLRPGVAPGADLLIGKVCNDGGSCPNSAIILGMEWAATSGAQVANLSLGGGATDGTDPLSMAVNELSAQHGILYVIAAGNSGPGAYTVAAPGAADAALTVAAVDKSDQMASFSGRGPRVGDDAPKPDIAAPGVAIVAARAAGTAMGTVVDDFYTAASGTSMATPHVAGGAAIIAQQHPDLSGEEIKSLLMGTALDVGHDLYAQGAGRMDLGRAVDPSVFAVGSVAFGRLTYPHQPAVQPARFRNVTDEPITLSLVTEFTAGDGSPAPAGLFTVGADEVTVPANGEATVDITVDGRVLTAGGLYGRYSGWLQAYDGAGELRTAARAAALLEPERFQVDVAITGADPSTEYGDLLIVPMDDQTYLHDDPLVLASDGTVTADLFAGTYAVGSGVTWTADGVGQTALVVEPEVTVDGNETVTLDLADLERFQVKTPEPTEVFNAGLELERISATRAWGLTGSLSATYTTGPPDWWLLPTDQVSTGTLTLETSAVLVPPVTTLRAFGGGRKLTLDSRYATPEVSVPAGTQLWVSDEVRYTRQILVPIPKLTRASRPLPVVNAGTGAAEELAAAGVAGKLALLSPTDICGSGTCEYEALRERVAAAAELGAAGVLVAGSTGQVALPVPPTPTVDCGEAAQTCPPVVPYSSIPALSVPADGAAELADRLARGRAVRILAGGYGDVSTVYGVQLHDDRVPSMPYRVSRRDLDRTTHRIHAGDPGEVRYLDWQRVTAETFDDAPPALDLPRVATPGTLTVYVPEQPSEALDQFQLGVEEFAAPYLAHRSVQESNSTVSFIPVEQRLFSLASSGSTFTWNTGPVVPGVDRMATSESGYQVATGACSGCREGDTFWPSITLAASTGNPTVTMAGLINDTGAGTFVIGKQGCNHCEITLYDEGGQELTQTLIPISLSFGLSDPSAVPEGQPPIRQLPQLVFGGFWSGLIEKEANR